MWFHVRKFVESYEAILKGYRPIWVTNGTADIIAEVLPKFPMERLGPTTEGVVKLAALVAKGEVDRVLFFQDPEDLKMWHPENYALLRNCNLHGKKLCINVAARLWAEHETRTKGKRKRKKPPDIFTGRKGDVGETVAFIAHDSQKPRMAQFVLQYNQALRNFPRLIAASGTKVFIDDFLRPALGKNQVDISAAGRTAKQSHGPSGGDVIIADEIFDTFRQVRSRAKGNSRLRQTLDRPRHHILFFIDHKSTHAHEPDIQVLLETCVDPTLPVNLMLNNRMAVEWIERYV